MVTERAKEAGRRDTARRRILRSMCEAARGVRFGLSRVSVLLCLALFACGPGERDVEPDLVSPWVVSIEPLGETVDTEASFRVRFSEPIRRASVFWPDPVLEDEFADGIVLAKAVNERSVVSAANNPPLSATQRARTIPMVVVLEPQRDRATLVPTVPLDGLTEYVLVFSRRISDDRNNPLVKESGGRVGETLVFRFTTGPAPDRSRPQAQLASPPAGASGVPLDLPRVEVAFSKGVDVSTVTRESIGLFERGTGRMIHPDDFTLDESRLVMTLPSQAGESDCHQLCPSREYELWMSEAITDELGNPLDTARLITQVFKAADCLQTASPRIAAATVGHSRRDVSARITFRADMPVRASVEFVAGDEAAFLAACGDARTGECRELVGGWTPCSMDVCTLPADDASFACDQVVTLEGLDPATAYTWRVVATSLSDRRTEGALHTFTTLEPIERVVLNEIFASPVGMGLDEGRFIELYNDGRRGVNLTGWQLARCTDPGCNGETTNAWTMRAVEGSAELLPGQFAVASGTAFDAVAFQLPAEALRLRSATATTLGVVTKTSALPLALVRPDGVVVSTYGAHLGAPGADGNDGRSFERADVSGPDVRVNWGPSANEVGGTENFATPGRWNSLSPGEAPGTRGVLRSPVADTREVPLDLSEVILELTGAVPSAALTPQTIGLLERPSGDVLSPAAVELNGRVVRLLLADRAVDGCGTLCPNATYSVRVEPEVRDTLDRPLDTAFLAGQSFTTAACLDDAAPRLGEDEVDVSFDFESARLVWRTDKPTPARIEWVAGDEERLEDLCGGERLDGCRVSSVVAPSCAVDVCDLPDEPGEFQCAQEATLTGLRAGATYTLRIVLESDRGEVAGEPIEITAPPPPPIVITEINASPIGFSSANHGKFLELFNAGESEVDLRGWRLVRCREPSCVCPVDLPPSECYGVDWAMRGAGDTSVLASGSFAVAAGIDANSLDWEAFEVPVEVLHLRSLGTGTTVLANGLVKGTSTSCSGSSCAYALLTPGGALASSYGAHLGQPGASANDGRSFERIDPYGPDVAENWAVCAAPELELAPGNRATAGRPNSHWLQEP